MSKIGVMLDGAVLQEVIINKPTITIGRRTTNDIVLNHLAISGVHAMIETVNQDSFIEDLNSTNGTQVNGQPVKRHYLQNGDVIVLARYSLKYVGDSMQQETSDRQQVDQKLNKTKVASAALHKQAYIKVLNGSNEGKQLVLSKDVMTLGTPGIQVAAISRKGNFYFVSHIEGVQPTLLNNVDIGQGVTEIKPGDVVELSGTKLMFHVGSVEEKGTV